MDGERMGLEAESEVELMAREKVTGGGRSTVRMGAFTLTLRPTRHESRYWAEHAIGWLRVLDIIYISQSLMDTGVGVYVYPQSATFAAPHIVLVALQLGALATLPEWYNQHRVPLVALVRAVKLLATISLAQYGIETGFSRSLLEAMVLGVYLCSTALGHQLPFSLQLPLQGLSVAALLPLLRRFMARMWRTPGMMAGGRSLEWVRKAYLTTRVVVLTALPGAGSMEARTPSACPVAQACVVTLFGVIVTGLLVPLYITWLIERSGKRAYMHALAEAESGGGGAGGSASGAKSVGDVSAAAAALDAGAGGGHGGGGGGRKRPSMAGTAVAQHAAFLWYSAALSWWLLDHATGYCAGAELPCTPDVA